MLVEHQNVTGANTIEEGVVIIFNSIQRIIASAVGTYHVPHSTCLIFLSFAGDMIVFSSFMRRRWLLLLFTGIFFQIDETERVYVFLFLHFARALALQFDINCVLIWKKVKILVIEPNTIYVNIVRKHCGIFARKNDRMLE